MRARFAFAGALAAAILLAYSNSFSAGFVLDNRPLILQDPRVHQASAENVAAIFEHTYWWPTGESGLYRPLTTLSYLFNYSVLGNGDRPAGYHWVNLLLHFGNAFLLYLLIYRLIGKEWPAMAGALIWSVHPVLTEAVTNIVGRADLLAAMALLGGVLVWIRAREARGGRRAMWVVALTAITAAGLYSKESAVVLAGIVAAYELLWRPPRRGLWLPAIAVAVPTAMFLAQRASVVAASAPADFPYFDNPITGAGFWTGRLTALAVLGRYLGRIAWPATLSCDYSYRQIPLASGSGAEWVAWVAVAATVALLVAAWRRHRAVFLLGCFAAAAILPASNLLFATGSIMAERLVYGASGALVAAVAIVGYAAAKRWRFGRGAAVAAGLVACALGARTWVRNADWQNYLSLARATVAASPESFKSHQMLAEALFPADLDGAIADAERGIAILNTLPDRLSSPELYRLAGDCYLRKDDARALAPLRHGAAILEALRAARPGNVGPSSNDDVYRLLSMAELRWGDRGRAVAAAEKGRRQDPLNPAMYAQAGDALMASGDRDSAERVLMEGMLVTSDFGLRRQLVEAYARGPAGCATVAGPNGPAINPACAEVKRQMCGVAAEAIAIAERGGRENTARGLRESLGAAGGYCNAF